MTSLETQIPPSVLAHLAHVPTDRAVLVLVRHAARDSLPPDAVGYDVPITAAGRRVALELGVHLRARLVTLHTSPLARCVQTAEALCEGAAATVEIVEDRLLGDPGIYVVDDRVAWQNWEERGHEGVIRHLVNEETALPGMAAPDDAARKLLNHMLASSREQPGVHVFVTHDTLVTATAARLLGRRLDLEEWPMYLESAFFWRAEHGLRGAYRDHVGSVRVS